MAGRIDHHSVPGPVEGRLGQQVRDVGVGPDQQFRIVVGNHVHHDVSALGWLCVFELLDAEQPDGAATGVGDREGGVAVTGEVRLGGGEAARRRDADDGGRHQVAHRDPGEGGDDLLLVALGARRPDQEHADHDQPQADDPAIQRHQDAEADHEVAKAPADGRRRLGGGNDVPPAAPQQGANRPATVERERRYEVEGQQHHVHLELVVDQRLQRGVAGARDEIDQDPEQQ